MKHCLNPSIKTPERMCFLLDEGGGFVDLHRMPVAEIEAKEIVEHRFNATIIELSAKSGEVIEVIHVLVAYFEDGVASSMRTSGHDPVVIGRHHDVEEIGDLERSEVLRFDRDRVFGNQTFEPAFGLNIASPKGFVEEEKATVLQMATKSADEVIWLGHG